MCLTKFIHIIARHVGFSELWIWVARHQNPRNKKNWNQIESPRGAYSINSIIVHPKCIPQDYRSPEHVLIRVFLNCILHLFVSYDYCVIMMMICVRIVIVIISTKHAQKVIALSDEHSLSIKAFPRRFNCQHFPEKIHTEAWVYLIARMNKEEKRMNKTQKNTRVKNNTSCLFSYNSDKIKCSGPIDAWK